VTEARSWLAAGEAWMGRAWSSPPVRHADRPSDLPALLPGSGGQGRSPRHPGARNSARRARHCSWLWTSGSC